MLYCNLTTRCRLLPMLLLLLLLLLQPHLGLFTVQLLMSHN
jgi:hypothetical protein